MVQTDLQMRNAISVVSFVLVSLEYSARKFDTGSVPSAFFNGVVISEF